METFPKILIGIFLALTFLFGLLIVKVSNLHDKVELYAEKCAENDGILLQTRTGFVCVKKDAFIELKE